MRSFSVRHLVSFLSRQPLQSHALVPFRPTSSSSTPPVTRPFTFSSHIILVSPSSHTPLCLSVPHHPRQPLQSHTLVPFRPTSSSSTPPVTRPFTFSSHIILVSPSSHTPLCLSVPHHPRQPLQSHTLVPFRPTSSSSTPSHIPFYLSVPTSSPSAPPVTRPCAFPSHIIPISPPVTRPCAFPSHLIPVSPSSHTPFYLFISLNISSHLCVFSPLVLDTRGKCREFRRKRFTFPRGSQGHRLHRHLWRHPPFPPPRESAVIFRKNGSLSPVAGRGTGSRGLSRCTHRFHPRGKCREFLRKRFTFPRGLPGHRLHSHLWRHSPFPPPGESAGLSCENGSLSLAA